MPWIDILDGGNDAEEGRALGVGVDDADGIGDVITDPDLQSVGSDGDAYGVDAYGDAFEKAAGPGVDDVDGVGRGVGNKQGVLEQDDGFEVGAEEGWVADGGGPGGFCSRRGWVLTSGHKPDPSD